VARVLLAVGTQFESALSTGASRHGHEIVATADSAPRAIVELEATVVEVAVVSASPVVLSMALLASCDTRGVRIVAFVASDAERRHAASLGLFDLVDATTDWAEIEGVLAGTRTVESAPPATSGRGTVIAVWGPSGSPGRTSLAIAVAAELAAAGQSVALGDVDTHAASIAPSLGLLDEAPGFAAACRLAGTDALTLAELNRIAQRYSSPNGSFWVLTGLGRPARWPELSADKIRATILECRKWVDYTVLDVGASLENDEEISSDLFAPRRNAATLTALREADVVVAVGAADPVGLSRFLRSHAELLEVASSRVIVVANKVRATAIGLNPAGQVQGTLERFGGITTPILIPHDQSAFDAALLSGRTLAEVSPRSPARVAIQQLVLSRILPSASPSRAKAGKVRAGASS
jgi:MinD-like ATPase involved in chromosome partitioning or flagellar assembly